MAITKEILKNLFYYKDGFLYWKISTARRIKINDKAGSLIIKKEGNRRYIGIYGKIYLASRLIFLYHKGYLPKEIDHKDRDTANDKIENLRAATRSQNVKNRSSAKNSSSKFLGVRFRKKEKTWEAYIVIDKKWTYIGCFKSEEKAAIAYNEKAIIYHGEFANLNIISP